MSNSSLIDYTKISPNKTSPRNHVIDTITIHCVVGQCSVETLGNVFAPTSRQASSNYGIGFDGKIGMYVEEKDCSWCTSSASNDNRAITIEVASDIYEPYRVNEKAYVALIDLVTDICRRNGIKKLVWSTDKNKRMNHLDGCNMTVHRDYANKSCPGEYLYSRHGEIAAEVNARLNGDSFVITETAVRLRGTVTADVLNIRKAASTSSAVIGQHKAGDVVTIIAKTSNGWYRVEYPKLGTGYLYSNYVQTAPIEDKPSANEKDNAADRWAKDAVDFAVQNKILFGDERGNYKLHDKCTRQEMLVFLYRYYKLIKG